jgi:hypothetical protein
MTTERDMHDLLDRVAALRREVVERLDGDLVTQPGLGETLVRKIDDLVNQVVEARAAEPSPPDRGLAALVGLGPEAAASLGETRLPPGVPVYDETVVSERVVAVADLYYIYQHERIGLFRVMRKLQELFRAGTVRLSSGPGAYGLYTFDRRDVLRFTRRDRAAAYRRILGYGTGPAPAGARPNAEFHRQFGQFVNQVTLYWRDKRISDVIRERSHDASFGSIAIVRRAGLDLRNNLKFASFGHLNVLRVEVMQVLDEAFRILDSDDIKRIFGADTAWDVLEEVLLRYFDQRLVTSPRQRMAVAGRDILRWLAQPHILQSGRTEFETLLLEVAEPAEEWLTSAQAIGTAERSTVRRVAPFTGRRPQQARPATTAPLSAVR